MVFFENGGFYSALKIYNCFPVFEVPLPKTICMAGGLIFPLGNKGGAKYFRPLIPTGRLRVSIFENYSLFGEDEFIMK